MIIRMKSGACSDRAVGRFMFWPLDGPVITDKLTQRQIDNNLFASSRPVCCYFVIYRERYILI